MNAVHFETLYEVLWNYCVTSRVMTKTSQEDTSDEDKRKDFFAELLATLIMVYERKEDRKTRRGKMHESMFSEWQDEGSRKLLARDLYQKGKQSCGGLVGRKNILRQVHHEIDTIYENSIGDMYKIVCDGQEGVTKLLQEIVKATHASLKNVPQADLSEKLLHLRNKINFLIAIVQNYGHAEKAVARQHLKIDMLEGMVSGCSADHGSYSGNVRGPHPRVFNLPTSRASMHNAMRSFSENQCKNQCVREISL